MRRRAGLSRTVRSRPSRLLPPIALYALVAVLALAAPIAVSEEPQPPAEPAAAPAAPAPAPAEPAPAPAAPAPAPAAPAPAPAAPAAAPAAPAEPAPEQVLRDDAPADKPKEKKVIAIAAASAGVT